MKIVIIGGVALGATAAAKIRRKMPEAEIVILEANKHFSFSNCGLPYYLGDEITKENLIFNDVESFAKRDIKVLINCEATKLDEENKTIIYFDKNINQEASISYDKLILACGATTPSYFPINDNNIFVHEVRKPEDVFKIEKALETANNVAIIGAGFIGLETASNLCNINKQVTIFDASNQISNNLDYEYANIIENYLTKNNVKLNLNTKITQINDNIITTSDDQNFSYDLIIIATGVLPNSKWLKNTSLEFDHEFLVINEYCQSSNPDIYTGGDLVKTYSPILNEEVYAPFAWIANNDAETIANHLTNKKTTRVTTIMPMLYKILNYEVGSVGYNEKQLKAKQINYDILEGEFNAISPLMPGFSKLKMKIIYDKNSKLILGAQVIGFDKVDKKIDTLCALIYSNTTVDQLEKLQLGYAPPFNSTIDAFNFLGKLYNSKHN